MQEQIEREVRRNMELAEASLTGLQALDELLTIVPVLFEHNSPDYREVNGRLHRQTGLPADRSLTILEATSSAVGQLPLLALDSSGGLWKYSYRKNAFSEAAHVLFGYVRASSVRPWNAENASASEINEVLSAVSGWVEVAKIRRERLQDSLSELSGSVPTA